MSSSSDLWAKFREHNWEADEKWQDMQRQIENGSIEFPSGNTDEAIQKMKYKHFKRHVEPDFDYTAYPKYNETRSEAASQSQPSSSSARSAPRSNAVPNPAPQEDNRPITPIKLFWYGAQIFCFVNVVFHFIPLFFSSHSSYYRALYGAFIAYLLSLYKAVGKLQFNREALARILMNDNSHYLILCIALCLSAPSSGSLIPLGIYSMLHISSFTSINYAAIFPAPLHPFIAKLQPLFLKALNNQQQLLFSAASFEFFGMFIALFNLFLGNGALLPIAYYWFLTLRYMYSSTSKIAIDAIGVKLDGLFHSPSCPALVRRVYDGIKGFVRRSVQRYQV